MGSALFAFGRIELGPFFGGVRKNYMISPSVSLEVAGAKFDRVGAGASFLCALHCALMPLIVIFLPIWGLGFLASEPVEWALIACSAVLGALALIFNYRQHRAIWMFGVLLLFVALLLGGRVAEERGIEGWGQVLMVAGGLGMTGLHLLNRKLCRTCSACKSEGCPR